METERERPEPAHAPVAHGKRAWGRPRLIEVNIADATLANGFVQADQDPNRNS